MLKIYFIYRVAGKKSRRAIDKIRYFYLAIMGPQGA
jgi:hypothetical protein